MGEVDRQSRAGLHRGGSCRALGWWWGVLLIESKSEGGWSDGGSPANMQQTGS